MEPLPVGALFEPQEGQRTLQDTSRLSEQDFLQVLVAQLRNQNPLEPSGDSDFMSQIAQFEQLASLNKLNDTLSALTGLSLLGQASGLLGREVEAVVDASSEPYVGIVQSVQLTDGEAMLLVGELLIPVSAVRAVRSGS